jgi:hypothetical protein
MIGLVHNNFSKGDDVKMRERTVKRYDPEQANSRLMELQKWFGLEEKTTGEIWLREYEELLKESEKSPPPEAEDATKLLRQMRMGKEVE